jgi:hypothetical protein
MGELMEWARILAYISGTVDQELLLRNEYLAAENQILRGQLKGRPKLSDAERAKLGEIGRHAVVSKHEPLHGLVPELVVADGWNDERGGFSSGVLLAIHNDVRDISPCRLGLRRACLGSSSRRNSSWVLSGVQF